MTIKEFAWGARLYGLLASVAVTPEGEAARLKRIDELIEGGP